MKRNIQYLFLPIASIALLLFSVVVASGNIVVNGDFESNPALDGWSGKGVELKTIDGYGKVAKLDTCRGRGQEVLWQDFTIPVEASQLSISFDYLFSGKDNARRKDDYANAYLGYWGEDWTTKVLFEENSSGIDPDNNEFVSFSTTVDISSLAVSDRNFRLGFLLDENWSCKTDTKLFVDNVVVNAVPIPSALLLFGTGLAGLAAFRKKYCKVESNK